MKEYSTEAKKFNDIFVPGLMERIQRVQTEKQRFAYYTSADTAIKIIRLSELWLRNATAMNDFTEVSYGLEFVRSAIYDEDGEFFRSSVEDIFPGTISKVVEQLNGWVADWQHETYLACISEHDESEDVNGRLSMWRAYGNTALVINSAPMTNETDRSAVYSLPVFYLSSDGFWKRIKQITEKILIDRKYLIGLGQDTLVAYIKHMFFITAIATKHPGFSEEREWRIYYRPNEKKGSIMKKLVAVVGGTPQIIYVLPLSNDPENGLNGADIPNLLDRVIIGPTQFPYISSMAFAHEIAAHGIENSFERIRVSDIPLRVG